MKIISWNINWHQKKTQYKEPEQIRKQRIDTNQKKTKVAISILDNESPDVLALYEAGENMQKTQKNMIAFF